MDHTEFRETLDRLGLRQADFVRLLAYLRKDATDTNAVSRWATGRRPVPPGIVAILRLWELVSKAKRDEILGESKGDG